MNIIKTIIEWSIGIVVAPVLFIVMAIAVAIVSWGCDDYEWEGIGYDD